MFVGEEKVEKKFLQKQILQSFVIFIAIYWVFGEKYSCICTR